MKDEFVQFSAINGWWIKVNKTRLYEFVARKRTPYKNIPIKSQKEATMKKTVAIDFDGVIHSYTSGWQGPDIIPDPVVPGIADEIDDLKQTYVIVIYSTRAQYPAGERAMKQWLADNHIHYDLISSGKPTAVAYIDDRAICFDGVAKGLAKKVRGFKTWLEKLENKE